MAIQDARVNLTASGFPFNHEELSSTIFVNRGLDQQRQLLQGFDGKDVVESFGVIQTYFMQNVLPITRGYSSLHFKNVVAAATGEWTTTEMDDGFILRDDLNNTALYAPANGLNYILDGDVGAWRSYPFPGSVATTVTVAYLKGTSYICVAGLGLFRYDFYEKRLVAVDTAGINITAILGVAAAVDRLILWDANTLYWSSATNPQDFLPALSTGAGSSSVLAARGAIVAVLPIADGFICYTTYNATAGTYSGDAVIPWIFREIPDSAGIAVSGHVSYEANSDIHFAWTTSGLQRVSIRESAPVFPELTDSIARGLYSQMTVAGWPELVRTARFSVRVKSVGSRYVVISLRPEEQVDTLEYPFAYVYDIAQDRFGRLDIPHVDVLEFREPEFVPNTSYQDLLDAGTTYDDLLLTAYSELSRSAEEQVAQPGESFGILQRTGAVYTAIHARDVDSVQPWENDDVPIDPSMAANPCIIHGRYKMIRGSALEMQEIQAVRLVNADVDVLVHDMAGDYVRKQSVTAAYAVNLPERLLCRVYGDSVSIKISGRFSLTDLAMRFRIGGNRNAPRR